MHEIAQFYHTNPWPAVAILAILAFVFIKVWEIAPSIGFILTLMIIVGILGT